MRFAAFRSAIIFALMIFAALTALGQSDRGTITGAISDSTGAVIANAAIQAKNVDTGAIYPVASSSTGNYTLAELPAGRYELDVNVPGFKKYVRQGLTVQVAQTLRIDAVLEVGAATESVTVTEQAPLLKTEGGELSHNVATQKLNDLPLLPTGTAAGNSGIRNPVAVVALMPGSYFIGTGANATNSTVRINGAPTNTEVILVEGQDATNPIGQGLVQQNQQGADSIQEWTVQTSNYAAEFGQAGGGIMNVTMKSGTNQWHGSGYEYFVNEDLNGGQPFTGSPNGHLLRPKTRRNDFGFTLGGPVWIPKIYDGRNRTFFFFTGEEYKLGQNVIPTAISVPTQAYRQGNFSQALLSAKLGTDPLGNSILGNEIYDPSTLQTVGGQLVTSPFLGNTIPAGRMDAVALKVQSLLPLPTNSGLFANNYQQPYLSQRTTNVPSIKVDQVLGSKDKLSFYWSMIHTFCWYCSGAQGMPQPIDGDIGTDIRGNTTRLSYDRTITPSLLLHAGAGFAQNNLGQPAVTPDYDTCGQLGLCGPFARPATFPVFSTLGNAQGGGPNNTGQGAHNYTINEQPTAIASLTWVKSNHTYKFGGQMLLNGNIVYNNSTLNGTYAFSNLQTALPYVALSSATGSVAGNTIGFPYASFLLGLVSTGNIHDPSDARIGKSQWAGYAQDTWKVTRRFTLDYGLRYDYSTYFKEQYGRAPDFAPTLPNPIAGGHPGATIYQATCRCEFAHNYPWAFGPRLGAAYQITSRTVARAGFGVAFSGSPIYGSGSGAGNASNPFGPNPSPYLPSMVLSKGTPFTAQQIAWPNLDPGQFPKVSPGTPPVGAGPPAVIDQNAGRPARNLQWSVGVQREIIPDLVVEAAYVGSRGAWWAPAGAAGNVANTLVNYNYLSPQLLSNYGLSLTDPSSLAILTAQVGSAAAGPFRNKIPFDGFPLTATVAQSLRPFPQYNSALAATWAPLGDTWYNSLQVKATKRLSHGLDLIYNFTWAKEMDNLEGTFIPIDVGNRKNARTIATLYRPLVTSFAVNYTVPALPADNSGAWKPVRWIARDWQLGGFFQYASGALIPPPGANLAPALGNLVFESTTQNRVAGVPLFTHDLNCHCFDPSTTFVLNPSAWANPAPGQFGSATYYNDYRAQRRPVENFSFGRLFRIRERASLTVRVEFTNLFNRTEVNDPSSTNPQQTQTRVINGNTNSQTTAGFGFINTLGTTFGTPRQGQIVARFSF
ncbi:MAG TPA: TonB-dependent receptor [Bryobacteraceae bacterium]